MTAAKFLNFFINRVIVFEASYSFCKQNLLNISYFIIIRKWMIEPFFCLSILLWMIFFVWTNYFVVPTSFDKFFKYVLFLILINLIITYNRFRQNCLYVINRIDLINILNFMCIHILNHFWAIKSLRFVIMRSRRYNFIMELIFLLKCFQIINIILFLLILLPIVIFFLFSIHFTIILTKIVKLWFFMIA